MVDQPLQVPESSQDKLKKLFDNKNEVFGTPETLKRFATIKDRLAVIATKDVLLISPNDLFPGGNPRTRDAGAARLMDVFDKAGIPPGVVTSKQIKAIVDAAIINSPTAFSSDVDNDGKIDLGIVVTPAKSRSPNEGITGPLSGIIGTKLHSIPGSASDIDKLIMFHETRHIGQRAGGDFVKSFEPTVAGVRRLESDADRTALVEGLRAGISRDVIKTYIQMREAATVNYYSLFNAAQRSAVSLNIDDGMGDHTTHAFISGDKFQASPQLTAQKLEAMKNVNSVLNSISGKYALEESIGSAIQFGGGENENRRLGLLSAEGLKDFKPENKLDVVNLGKDFAAANPAFTYLMLERVKSAGVFQAGSEEDKYVTNVMSFFKKHVDLSDLKSPDMLEAKERLARESIPTLGDMQQAEKDVKEEIARTRTLSLTDSLKKDELKR